MILHLNLSFDHQTPSVALNGSFKKSDVGTFWKNCSCGQVGFLSTTMRSNDKSSQSLFILHTVGVTTVLTNTGFPQATFLFITLNRVIAVY